MTGNIDSLHETVERKVRSRSAFTVGLLSFLWSGLGHIYIGEGRRGVILFLGETGLTVIFFISTLAFSIAGLFSFLAVFLSYRIYVIVDSIRLNRKKGSIELKRYNRFLAYAGFVMLASFLTTTIQFTTARIEAFKIPSPSMVPTFIIGDHIMIDKWAYSRSRPEKGDPIVFRFPRNPQIDFIKRCIAVEGDTVEISDKVLFLNGRETREPYAIFSGGSFFFGRDNFGPYKVPRSKLFVLGDNRDNSNDSRYWGPVDVKDVKGKVRVIYWSWDSEEKRVRWERIGRKSG